MSFYTLPPVNYIFIRIIHVICRRSVPREREFAPTDRDFPLSRCKLGVVELCGVGCDGGDAVADQTGTGQLHVSTNGSAGPRHVTSGPGASVPSRRLY